MYEDVSIQDSATDSTDRSEGHFMIQVDVACMCVQFASIIPTSLNPPSDEDGIDGSDEENDEDMGASRIEGFSYRQKKCDKCIWICTSCRGSLL